ncbi:MAG: hypothetical protein FRX49_08452 [Trebouxia sp. A1-2]|nr:MAG: hypothetical protein FRX49_08452 [Trebouxia sp. A1-2]
MSGVTEQKAKQVPDRTCSLLSRPTSRLTLYDSDIREELVDTMLLYNIPFVKDGTGSPTDRPPRNRFETVMPNGPDDRRFSAAGVLALTFGPPDGHIRLLMTQEKANKSRWRKKMVKRDLWRTMHPFNIPGGKRKIIDVDAKATALRELEEETAGLLTSSNVDLAQAATHFGPPSNYYAFTCKLEGQDDLPERFAALIADPPADMRACRTKALIWMPVCELARWPRSDFLDRLFNGTSIPAWLCAQQQEHDLLQEQAQEQPLLDDELSVAALWKIATHQPTIQLVGSA